MSQRYIGGLIYNPPGGYSGYFDGSGDNLTASSANVANAMGTGNWTAEAWIYLTSGGGTPFVFDTLPTSSGSATGLRMRLNSSNQLQLWQYSSAVLTSSAAVTVNAWTHVALVKNSGTTTAYVNGVASGTYSDSGDYICGTNRPMIGSDGFNNGSENSFPGYISNLRLVKGTAVYTSAFTPPNGPLQAISGTSLLTCAYSTFRDGSSNNFTITVNGNTSVSTQNPFPITTLPNPALGNQGNGVYSMSQYVALKAQGLWPAYDPYFNYTTLLLHGDGTNGAQNNTFLDSSTNNFTITRNGNTTQGTFSPFSVGAGEWSDFFDGSGDYLSGPTDNAISTFTGDFTIEMWANFSSIAASSGLMQCLQASPSELGWQFYWRQANTSFRLYSSALGAFDFSYTPTVGSWIHIALSRSGTNLRCFVNGTQVGTTQTMSGTVTRSTVNSLQIGGGSYGITSINGYLSNVRLVNGTAVYTSAFTPSTTPLTAITNTSLLTCQSNRFVDNSANAFAITVNGNTSIQPFSPFAPSAAYDAATNGGSGYFDGSGDYLDVPSTSNLSFGTGDFTVEFWFNPNAVSSSQNLFVNTASGGGNTQLGIFMYTGTKIRVASWDTAFLESGAVLVANSFQHVAVCRSGTTFSLFINGTRAATTTSSNNFSSTDAFRIGASKAGGDLFTGYISNLRSVKGTAVYDPTQTSITVPTAPLTAISNTQLLLNFTNAGILDNTGRNDLETVGNAQISTSVKKFGTGSLAFDGTGDYLVNPYSPNIVLGSGDFTVEFWWNSNGQTSSAYATQLSNSITSSPITGAWSFGTRFNTTNAVWFAYYTGSFTDIYSTAVNPNDGSWHHLAACRSGSTLRLFMDGVQVTSATVTTSLGTPDPLMVGYNQRNNAFINGYIDDLRITKGVARYTSNFTPQTSQWQDQ